MPSSGRVQSACMARTPGAVSRALTVLDSRINCLLTMHVTHQSAVTSTNTVLPSATSRPMAASSKGFQNPAGSSAAGVDREVAICVGTTKAANARATTAMGDAGRKAIGKRCAAHRATAIASTRPTITQTAAGPSVPARMVSSHAAVPASSRPRMRRRTIIQRPGRGSSCAMAGSAATRK